MAHFKLFKYLGRYFDHFRSENIHQPQYLYRGLTYRIGNTMKVPNHVQNYFGIEVRLYKEKQLNM